MDYAISIVHQAISIVHTFLSRGSYKKVSANRLIREAFNMGRKGCILSNRDLDILERLYENASGYRYSAIARDFGVKAQAIQDNLDRLQQYKLVATEPRKEVSGVGSYYYATEAGKQIYEIIAPFRTPPKKRRRKIVDATGIDSQRPSLHERLGQALGGAASKEKIENINMDRIAAPMIQLLSDKREHRNYDWPK